VSSGVPNPHHSLAAGSIQSELEVLFEETVDLANYLKRRARHTHRGEKLSPSGRILLQSIHLNGPQTVPALAHLRSTSRQNIQVLVDRLAATGYVEFVTNPSHRRSDFVQLTPAGEAMLSSANQREAGLLETLQPHTSELEVQQAANLLRRLRLLMGGERKRRKSTPQGRSDTAETQAASPSPATESFDDQLPVSLL